MCIRDCTCFITSTGHGDPAMMPVRSDVRSNSANRGWSSWAMNMVGTPYSDVQRSAAIVSRVASGSNASAGTTMQAPWVVQARLPSTIAEAVVERDRDADAVVLGVA